MKSKIIFSILLLLNCFKLIVATIDEERDFIERQFLNIHRKNIKSVLKGYELLLSYGVKFNNSLDEITAKLGELKDSDIYEINNICNIYCYEVLNSCTHPQQAHYEEECFINSVLTIHNMHMDEIEQLPPEQCEHFNKIHFISFLASLVMLKNALGNLKNQKL